MWNTLRASKVIAPDFFSSAQELLQSTSKALVFTVAGLGLSLLLATVGWPDQIGNGVWLLTPLVGLTCLLTYHLMSRHYVLAQVVWQIGLAISITLAVILFSSPEIAFIYALLPFMAVVTLGWWAGLLAEALIASLILWLAQGYLAPPLPTILGIGIVLAGIFASLVGWASASTLLTVSEWSFFSFEQARKSLEEARERRAELARLLKELDRAYNSLERANHMLVRARMEAEEARDARNRLALAISHELRTPLNLIIGFSELMVNSPSTYAELPKWPEGLYEDLQEIYHSSTHLLRLVNDVLDLGQIENLQMMLLKQWVDPAQIVQEVEEMVRSSLTRKGLWFRKEIEADLPRLFIDNTRIRQVLLNLVSNSLRFTEKGGITVWLGREADDVLYCVEDTGPGIPAEDLFRIFEPFQRASRPNWQQREGAGLGLAISKRFIELHGGRIWAESQIGKGSRFYFKLPMPMSASVPSHPTTTMSDSAYWHRLKEGSEKTKMLLVVAAHPSAGEVIAPYVQGYNIATITDPTQITAWVSELLPSAILVDQVFQKQENGLARWQLPYDLPVISFAFPGSPGQPKRVPDGAKGYLIKPIERSALVDAIRSLGPALRYLLVVDDDPGMLRFVKRTLDGAVAEGAFQGDLELATALTGAAALANLRERRPDAVLLDLTLPDISGWDVLKELCAEGIPVILITAFDYPRHPTHDHMDALRVMMRRPLSRDELRDVLDYLLKTIRPVFPNTGPNMERSLNPPA